jgi:8-oxo-dGTP diphosphatase
MRRSPIDVAVNILRDADGRVLVAERTERQISAGFWELPGGKVDPGETPIQAAARELAEEIGVEALVVRPWIQYLHSFRTRDVRLFFFRVERWAGTPHGREGQRLAWIDPASPSVSPILPSADRVLTALGLPQIYAAGAGIGVPGIERFMQRVQVGLRQGLRLIQLREPDMAPDQRVNFARRVASLAHSQGARVLLVGSALEARRAGLDGVHSSCGELRRLSSRPSVKLWVTSCHHADDLHRAMLLGADAAVLSPVLPTEAHPDYAPLGWDGFQRLATQATIPVFAQGGVSQTDLAKALAAGAAGITTSSWGCEP